MFSLGKGKIRRTGTDPGVLAGAGSLLRNYHFNYHFYGVEDKFCNVVSCFTSTPINHKVGEGGCAPPTSPLDSFLKKKQQVCQASKIYSKTKEIKEMKELAFLLP